MENNVSPKNKPLKGANNASNDHAKCANIVFNPDEKYAESKRFWQGCPSIMHTPKGHLYAAWYSGGTKEPSQFNYNLLVRSSDFGKTWSSPLLVIESIPDLAIRAIDIQLWLDPENKAWIFWVQRNDAHLSHDHNHLSVWAITSENIDDKTPSWSKARKISEGFLRCQPTVLRDGRYLLCAYDWTSDKYQYSESNNGGFLWERKSGGTKLATPFDETMILERKDASLWMLARSDSGKLAESFSYDGGTSWSDGKPSAITAPSSRFFIKRLNSERVILVVNDSESERTNMTAFISEDDGESWPYSLLIDNSKNISYPDLVEADGGLICLVHDCGRTTNKEILLSCFKEEDVIAGKISGNSFLRRLISKAPQNPHDEKLYLHQLQCEKERFKF